VTHYIALIHKEGGSVYGVSFPDLPGVTAAADSLDEAMHAAADVLAFAAEDWREIHGNAFPEPRTIDAIRDDATLADDLSDAIVAAVPMIAPALAAA
jgi:predicted RNase H-like HicB family nuclease